ncbi:hypothetical protein TNCV_5014561 [Trichonephila clavipes]|nr:hypothetical protein TNCV_5014561 [Trichonephila clavipes]
MYEEGFNGITGQPQGDKADPVRDDMETGAALFISFSSMVIFELGANFKMPVVIRTRDLRARSLVTYPLNKSELLCPEAVTGLFR